jgi:bla regulator protein BlaR1
MLTLLQANYLGFFNWVLITSAKASIFIIFLLGVKFVLRHKLGAGLQYMLWAVLIIGLMLPRPPNTPVCVYNFLDSSRLQQNITALFDRTTQSSSASGGNKKTSLDQTVGADSNFSKSR